jgi:cell division transport system ATP-binding protein
VISFYAGNYQLKNMVSLKLISKSYFGQNRVLEQCNLEMKQGDFLYVIGGSGAGKSSLLRMLATEESPSEGIISLFGYQLATASPATLRAIRQSIGYVPQDVRLISDLSVLDNVSLSIALGGNRAQAKGETRVRILEILEKLGLSAKKDKPASALSGGEAQRVALARALVRNPELIIADEPTGAQDRDFNYAIMDLLLKANLGGATVIVATHDREIVRRVRKRCAILRGGRIEVEDGGPQICTTY